MDNFPNAPSFNISRVSQDRGISRARVFRVEKDTYGNKRNNEISINIYTLQWLRVAFLSKSILEAIEEVFERPDGYSD